MTSPRKIREFADALERVGKVREAMAWRFLAKARQQNRVLTIALALAIAAVVAALAGNAHSP